MFVKENKMRINLNLFLEQKYYKKVNGIVSKFVSIISYSNEIETIYVFLQDLTHFTTAAFAMFI